MHIRHFDDIRSYGGVLAASLAIVAAPVAAQTIPRGDDATLRSVAVAARTASMHAGAAFERSARDAIRLTARDYASIATPVVMPYRSTPSSDIAPDGFTMRVPGTGLDLTNGSLSFGHANDGRHPKGVHLSIALTY